MLTNIFTTLVKKTNIIKYLKIYVIKLKKIVRKILFLIQNFNLFLKENTKFNLFSFFA